MSSWYGTNWFAIVANDHSIPAQLQIGPFVYQNYEVNVHDIISYAIFAKKSQTVGYFVLTQNLLSKYLTQKSQFKPFAYSQRFN